MLYTVGHRVFAHSYVRSVSSYPTPPQPRAQRFTDLKDELPSPLSGPLSPVSADYSRLSWPATPSTSVSMTSLHTFESKEAEAHAVPSSLSDDPSPPYMPPSPATLTPPVSITPLPLAHSRENCIVEVIAHAHTDQMV